MFGEYKWLKTYEPESEQDLNNIIQGLDRQAENLAGDMEGCSESEKESLMSEYHEINELISMLCDKRNKLFGNK